MKLRTIVAELQCVQVSTGAGVDLDADVIATLGVNDDLSFEQMLVLAPKGAESPREGFIGITMIYRGFELPEKCRPEARCIEVASTLSREDFELSFAGIPELHIMLDLQKEKLFHAFQISYDLRHYAEYAYEILGNPLFIVNTDRRLLASAGEFPEDREDVAEQISQGYVLEQINAELEATGIIEDVRRLGHSIISENERFGQRWVTSVISYHRMEMGRFDMLEQNRRITDADLELIDFAGSLAAILIERLGVAGERAGMGSSVLEDLLTDSLANERTLRAQLALSGMPLDDTYALFELRGEERLSRDHLERIAARIEHAFLHCLWTIHEGHLVVLVALGARNCAGWDAYERAERLVGQRKGFVSTLEHNHLRAYVAEPFEQLGMASARYMQCGYLQDLELSHKQPIVWFWQHRYAVLAALANTFDKLDMMLDKRVLAMGIYDQDHGTAYLETACATVDHPGSPADAAKALNVHRNTYFYRVKKIEELFFLDLHNGEDRLAVAFSTRYLSGMGGKLYYDVSHMPEAWRRSFANG